MRRRLLCAALALIPTLTTLHTPRVQAETRADEVRTRRYALIVTYNGSVDRGVRPLKYADDDGARYYELFSSVADEAVLLTTLDAESQRLFPDVAPHTRPPTRRQLRQSVAELAGKIRRDRANGLRAEVYLIFAGHGNVSPDGEGYLSLSDGKLRRSELYKDVIKPLDASMTHLIIDACHAYFMVKSRGGGSGDGTWRDDRAGESLDAELTAYLQRRPGAPTLPSTVGVIVSTSGAAEVHEWRRFRGGVFSHELRSGLLGAADVNGDRRVTYDELEAYLAAANAAITSPEARVNVHAQAPRQDRSRPLIRLDSFKRSTTLELERGQGRYVLEDARGLRYADLHADPQTTTRMVLLHRPVHGKPYYLRSATGQARVPVATPTIKSGALAFAAQTGQSRGAVEDAYREGLYAVPFTSAFYAGFMAGRARGDAAVEARAPIVTERVWSWRPELGYTIGRSLLPDEIGGAQHTLSLGLRAHHEQGWSVGPLLQYGLTLGAGGQAHRVGLGVEGAWTRPLGGSWSWGLSGRVLPQLVLLNQAGDSGASALSADPLSLRSALALRLAWQQLDTVQVGLRAGAAVDIITQANSTRSAERLALTPQLGVEVWF